MTTSPSPTSANRQIARAAGVVMAGFILSNLTGLVRQVLVSSAFGTSRVFDAYSAASRFPDVLFTLIAGGALASAFVPTLTGLLQQDDHAGAWELISAVLNLVFLILTVVSAVSALLAPQIVRYILAPGFEPSQQALTAELLRILLLTSVIFGISGLLMGVLNAHQIFLWPALASSMYWLGMIFGVLFLTPSLDIFGLAWGAVIGATLHLAIQLPGLLRLPSRRYFATLGLHLAPVREVIRLMGPRLLGVAVVQLNFIVNIIIASAQPEGSLSAINYAWAIMTLPEVAIAQAIAIAALPTFSAQVARGAPDEMRTSLAATLRGVILLSLPASLGLILLRRPVISMLFQHRAFGAQSTELVAWALLWYTAGLVGHSVVEIVSRAFYALHDTKTPVFVGVAAMSLNLVFSLAFSAWFTRLGWMPHGGLALANSLATGLEMIGLLYFMRRKLNGLDGAQVWSGAWQAGLATLGMGLAVWGWLALTAGQSPWLVGIGGVVIGGLIYGGLVLWMGVPEVRLVLGALQRRLQRSYN